MGCNCPNCNHVRVGLESPKWVSSLAIIDDVKRAFWMVDATPDLSRQYDFLMSIVPGDYTFEGIILTHAHIGHYLGLVYLGKEAFSAKNISIIATDRMIQFLVNNAPFSQLVELGNIRLFPTETSVPIKLTERLAISLLPVPHRNEFSDTAAVQISGYQSSLLYVPDIDDWNLWQIGLNNAVTNVSIAILDGTFYNEHELPNRARNEIPHPTVMETMERLQSVVDSLSTKVYFTHLNHSNRLWDKGTMVEIEERGFRVVRPGEQFVL